MRGKSGYQGLKSNPVAPHGRSRASVRGDYSDVDLSMGDKRAGQKKGQKYAADRHMKDVPQELDYSRDPAVDHIA